MESLVYKLAVLLLLPTIARCDVCSYTATSIIKTSRPCSFWKWGRCTQYRSQTTTKSKCCEGWTGIDSGCNSALCNGRTNGCSVTEGYVELRTGSVYTSSGGRCIRPDVCDSCNPGYYASGSYCRACTLISNCLHPECTSHSNSICKYCEGEVKNQYGWYAYIRFFPDECRQACSWRSGSRCYPGTCSDETTSSCRCMDGFAGSDCNTITEDPYILQNFLRLTELTETSINHVEAPVDSSKGPPQAIIWTNNVRLEQFIAYVDANYQKDLPVPPDNFYVNLGETKIGIINGGINVQWTRGSTIVASPIRRECETDPMPNNYRCQLNATFSDYNWQEPFEHNDILKFTVFATNGGYVSIYNREQSNRIEKYTVNGKTKTNMFEVGFDTERPNHCAVENSECSSQPLILPDTTTEGSISVRWSGWEDSSSGIKYYELEVFHLQPTGTDQDSALRYGDKVQDAMIAHDLPDVSQTTVTVSSTGPYAVTLSAYDNAGNHRTARRLVIHDDNSIVTVQGTRTLKANNDGSCTWNKYPSPPIVTNADPNANCDWITKHTSIIYVAWRERFTNVKHHDGKWLNPVQAMENIDAALDDNDGKRTTKKTDNVLGITGFQVAYNVTFEQEITRYPFTDIDDIYAESFNCSENVFDGMKLAMQIRASDIMGTFAEDAVEVKVDMSPPVIEELWLTKEDRLNISVHDVEDLTKLQIEWKAYDIHSGMNEIYWRLFDNFTGSDIDHGTVYLSPQGDTQNEEHCTNLYGNYPRGANCYCTPYDGCFHQYFQVKPQIHTGGINGLNETEHLGVHDSDYFIEITATNMAMLKTTKIVKISPSDGPGL